MDRVWTLKSAIERALEVAETTPDAVRLKVTSGPDSVVVAVDSEAVTFPMDASDWDLEWYRLLLVLRPAAERARLLELAYESGERSIGGWSVFTTAFAFDWLIWNAGGIGTERWKTDLRKILHAADIDGDVFVASRSALRRQVHLTGTMRGRRLIATLHLSKSVRDDATR